MTGPMRVALASAVIHFRVIAVERFAYAALVGQPLLIATAAMFMLRNRPDFEAVYVVVGTTLTALWTQALLFSSGEINSDRFAGRIEYLEAAPASMFSVAAGRTMSGLCFAATSAVSGYIVAAWLFEYTLAIVEPAGFAVSAILTVFSLWAFGLLLAPLSFRWIAVRGFLTGLEYPLYVLCGFLFPIVLLPGWLEPVSYALPPFWGAEALHATSSGAGTTGDVFLYWLLILASSVLFFIAARLLFNYFLQRSRRQGLLGAV